MSNISEIDKNFKIETKIGKKDIKFYSADSTPFKVHGVFKENGLYRRMPEDVAKKVSDGVYWLHTNTAGGRVRFTTDSSYVSIHAKMGSVGKMGHFAFAGSIGFDLYADNVYRGTYIPPVDITDLYEGTVELGSKQMREIMISFPLYSNVRELYIGIEESASLGAPSPYKIEKPIVYYGSSITQGGCASRPSTSYQAPISRELNADFINLGFSGNARAEDEMIDYIKSLDMSVFVLDYDHNAPNPEHLEATHEKLFMAVREANPNLPIIMMNRPKLYLTNDEKKRLEIVKKTYENALSHGDKNVYFIDNTQLCALCGNEGTVDNCHPTDFGFASMAQAIIPVLKEILK